MEGSPAAQHAKPEAFGGPKSQVQTFPTMTSEAMTVLEKFAKNKKSAAAKRATFKAKEATRKRDRVKAFVKESISPTAEDVAEMQKKVAVAKEEKLKLRKRDKVKNFFQGAFKKE